MWNSIPMSLQEEWKAFYDLEPTLVERSDWNFAHVTQLLARTEKPLKEFVLPFGDREPMKVAQPIEYQERVIDAWIQGSNALLQKT